MWSSQCVYYHYWIEKPEKVYPVYKLVSNVWEIEVLMSKNGVTTVNTLNVNNPSVNMVIQNNKVPMYVSNVEYEQEVLPTAGVVFEGSLIPSFVSDVNMPIGGSIGEYQVDIFKNDITIDPSIIGCQANNCHVECPSD